MMPERDETGFDQKFAIEREAVFRLATLLELGQSGLFHSALDEVVSGDCPIRTDMDLGDNYRFIRDSSYAERAAYSAILQRLAEKAYPDFPQVPEIAGEGPFGLGALSSFQMNGVHEFGTVLDQSQIRDVFAYLETKPVFNAHIYSCSDRVPRYFDDPTDPAGSYQFGAYDDFTTAGLPHIPKIATDPALLAFLKGYFGVPPVLRDLYCWWSFPQPQQFGPQPGAGQGFHRDYRALQDIQFFICLTDTGTDGAHHYFAGTHDERAFAHRGHLAKWRRKVFEPGDDGYDRDEEWLAMLGKPTEVSIKAGHAFMIDAMGLHRGTPPKESRRLVFSARFTAGGGRGLTNKAERLPTERDYSLSVVRSRLPRFPEPQSELIQFHLDDRMRQVLRRLYIELYLPDGIYDVHPGTLLEPPCTLNSLDRHYHEIGAFSQIWSPLGAIRKVGRYCSIAPGLATAYEEHPGAWLTSCAAVYQHGDTLWRRLRDEAWHRKDFQPSGFAGDSQIGRPITVGNDVWIGADVYIRRGVRIGNGAVIGARAMVTRDVPAFVVSAGNPARVRKPRFPAEVAESLAALRWWDYCILDFTGIDVIHPDRAVRQLAVQIEHGRMAPFMPQQYSLGELMVLRDAEASNHLDEVSG